MRAEQLKHIDRNQINTNSIESLPHAPPPTPKISSKYIHMNKIIKQHPNVQSFLFHFDNIINFIKRKEEI